MGSALARRFEREASIAVVGGEGQPDWTDGRAVDAFFAHAKPDAVIVAAGRAAGIGINRQHPADLMIENLLVAAHVIPAAWRHGTRKLLYLSSSCTYPREAPQPFRVDALWTGPVEPTSAAYATAKLAGLRLCDAYRQQHGVRFLSAIVADVFGPGDDFSADGSGHVVSALISRMHRAKAEGVRAVTIWGSGTPRREFLYVEDLADAVAYVMRHYNGEEPINIGTGVTTSIRGLAETIREIVGFDGELVFDTSRPDGAPVKWLDSQPLRSLGWSPSWDFRDALVSTYEWFRRHEAHPGP
jgi:GDP-L-fucose synthase